MPPLPPPLRSWCCSRTTTTTAALRVAVALTAAAVAVSYTVDAFGVDLLVEQQADDGIGKMMALPAWYVSASPWIAGLLSVAAIVLEPALKGLSVLTAMLFEKKQRKQPAGGGAKE